MRKCLTHQKRISISSKSCFIDKWKTIINKRKESSSPSVIFQRNINYLSDDISKNSFFEEVPALQEFLTTNEKIYMQEIEYSNYHELQPNKINVRDPFECFHGVLYYIFYYSNSKLNVKEVSFCYSGAKNRKSLLSIIKDNSNKIDLYDILNIFSYTDINSQFVINCMRNAFFGVTFNRIKINPTAYSIRSGSFRQHCGSLISFNFLGYDEDCKQWIILDERNNINDLTIIGGFNLFYVRTTDKFYSSFKIQQTEPGYDGFWGFSIAAFDIHGIISYRDNINVANNEFCELNQISLENINDFTYDETIDMSDFLI